MLITNQPTLSKALTNPGYMRRLAERLPERSVTLLDTGCCGMAGAIGALASKYELSLKVAEPLAKRSGGSLRNGRGRLRHQLPPSN